MSGVGGSLNFLFDWNAHIFVTLGLIPSFKTLGQLFKIPPFEDGSASSGGYGRERNIQQGGEIIWPSDVYVLQSNDESLHQQSTTE